MKKLKTLLSIVLILLTIGGTLGSCSEYDDSRLWGEINNIKGEIAQLNSSLNTLKTVVGALEEGKVITEVTQTEGGYSITFNDGKRIEILHGKTGAAAPIVGVKEVDGIFYWTITTDGVTDFIYDNSDPKKPLPVSNKEGASPLLSIDASGYWVLNGTRITDANNQEVKAVGKDGDSFFKEVTEDSGEVIFTLTDGSTIRIPKANHNFSFVLPEGTTLLSFAFGENKKVSLTLANMTNIEILKTPTNWSVKLDLSKKRVEIIAPTAGDESYTDGIISLIGLDKKGNTLLASLPVCASIDFTDKAGTFVVCEGNMTSVNGTITYYDKNGKEFKQVFEQANKGLEIGNVCQDIFIANNRIYLLTQNGDNLGGAARLVVCEAKTMKLIYANPLIFKTPAGKATWPQHLVVVDDKTAYVQYSEAGWEATSGICRLSLDKFSVTVDPTLEGTFGAFTTQGATKTRMVLSRGKVYAGAGQRVVIINPATNSIEKTIPFTGRQVKGIVKAADNNLYITLAGTYSGASPNSGTFTSAPSIVAINHIGEIVSEQELTGIKLPIATWSPGVGMCASFTDPYLYFVDTDAFNASSASRYNYATKQLDKKYISGNETIYGIMGQHPTTKKLWVGTSSYVDTNIHVFDVSGATSTKEHTFIYPTQNEASPAGIDFAYRFTPEYLNR